LGRGLWYDGRTVAAGAQTDRRGAAWPVGDLLGGETPPAAFCLIPVQRFSLFLPAKPFATLHARPTEEQTMAARRTPGKQRPRKTATRQPEPVDDDLALADELLRLAREDQAVIEAEWKKFRRFLRQRGIRLPAKPIGAKKLREMAIREGLNPESNEFSRGIIEMREE
jgi:hypothetical protein